MKHNLEELLLALQKLNDYSDRPGGASEDEIQIVESTLGVPLPTEYRDFLRRVGFAEWLGNEIFGVSQDREHDVIHKTNYARQEDLPPDFLPIPLDAVVIGRYGGGGWYILHGMQSSHPGTVDLILDETFNEPDQSWPNFVTFVWDWFIQAK